MKSDRLREVDELRSKNKFVFSSKREGSQLRPPTKKEQTFLEALRPSARTTMARQLLSMPPAEHFKDDIQEQSVTPTELLDEDIIASLDTSVLFDPTKTLPAIIATERARLAALPKQSTPEQLQSLQRFSPAARVAAARQMGLIR